MSAEDLSEHQDQQLEEQQQRLCLSNPQEKTRKKKQTVITAWCHESGNLLRKSTTGVPSHQSWKTYTDWVSQKKDGPHTN